MQYLIETEINNQDPASHFKIQFLTPTDPEQRGAQLSLRVVDVCARQLFNELEALGVCVSFIFLYRINDSFHFCLIIMFLARCSC